MAKWDIKMVSGASIVKPARNGILVMFYQTSWGDSMELVIPNLLEMGWIKSPPYFCVASKMARDVAKH